jgi:hypothetical protein
MPDIWSGIGTEIAQSGHGEWLYKVGGQIRGPLPMQALAQKLVRGEIGLDTQVAREGSEFHPVARVAAFAQHVTEAKKQAGKRHAARTRKIILASTVPALIVIAVAGWFIWTDLGRRKADAEHARKAAEEAILQQRKKAEALPDMGLVALVSLGNEDSVKIHQTPSKRGTPTPGKKTPATTASRPEPEEMVEIGRAHV